MPSVADQLGGLVAAECILMQEALTSREIDMQAGEEQPPPYDEGSLILYPVNRQLHLLAIRLMDSQTGCRSWCARLHNFQMDVLMKIGTTSTDLSFSILAMLNEAMTFIVVDRDYVQDLEENNGFWWVTRPPRQIMRSLWMMSSATIDRSLASHWVRLGELPFRLLAGNHW